MCLKEAVILARFWRSRFVAINCRISTHCFTRQNKRLDYWSNGRLRLRSPKQMKVELKLAEEIGTHLADGARAVAFRMVRIEPYVGMNAEIVLDFTGVRH